MEPYGNGDHGSGVVAFQIGRSHIDVRFRNGSVYRYTAASVGQDNLDRMAALACPGSSAERSATATRRGLNDGSARGRGKPE